MKYFKTYLIFFALLLAGMGEVYAQTTPAPGREISNIATGSFDGLTGEIRSNEVKVVIEASPEFLLVPNNVVSEFRGRGVEMTHFLRNAGNQSSTIDITITNREGDDFDLDNLQIESRSKSKFTAASQANAVSNSINTSITLQPGEEFSFTFSGEISSQVERKKITALIDVEAISREFGTTITNTDTVKVLVGTQMSLQKEQINADNLQPGDTFSYLITGSNIGDVNAPGRQIVVDNVPQNSVVLLDSIPANVTFAGFGNVNKGTPLYHLPGTNRFEFTATPPQNLAGVDLIAVAYDSILVNESFSLSFNVRINDNAAGALQNTAEVSFIDPEGSVTTTAASNEVIASLPRRDARINYFTDGGFGLRTSTSRVGRPLFLEASAAQCNTSRSQADEVTITLNSLKTGDKEVFTGKEVGINSGIFRIGKEVPTRDANKFDVLKGNEILETLERDEIEAVLECQALTSSSTVKSAVVLDPFGVIFDSETGAPVTGAEVQVINVATGQPAKILDVDGSTELANLQTTDASGKFRFPFLQSGDYQIEVTPPGGYEFASKLPVDQLAGNRSVDSLGSYGNVFSFQPDPGGVDFDIPLDPQSQGVLFVEKRVDRKEAEVGDYVTYTINIRSEAVNTVQNLTINDDLPLGFEYQLGSAQVDGDAIANPEGGKGPSILFNVGNIQSGSSKTLTYRVFIGPGARDGDGTNVAVAQSDEAVVKTSNLARVKIDVRGGVFSNEGLIIGKVFSDCNLNGVQDAGESGVPGVRLYLENGNYVITDGNGLYTFYGIQPNKHVIKIDNYSLPKGSRLNELDNRNAGDASTRFVDLKKGQIHRADFAICNCTDGINKEIEARKKAYSSNSNGDLNNSLKSSFTADGNSGSSRGAFDQASGTIGEGAAPKTSPQTPGSEDKVETNSRARALPDSSQNASSLKLEEALINAKPGLGFLNIADNDTLTSDQVTILAKGTAGAQFRLSINGSKIGDQKIGQRSVSNAKGMQAWEFVSLSLQEGPNTILLQQVDPFGNVRGSQKIVVYAPGKLSKLKLSVPKNDVPADGTTTAIVRLEVMDDHGISIGSKVPVTLDVSEGDWNVKDQDSKEPGTQTYVEGGAAEFELASSIEPKTVTVRAHAGVLESETKVTFLPDLRPLIAAGIVEGTVRLRDPLNITPAASSDGFEKELTALSLDFGNFTADARINFFLKGKVRGDVLLTAGYDSEKDSDDRLFRDIRPDEFYPVYGESSIKGFDAQSTSRLYIRVDKNKTYALYGDFITQERDPDQQLGDYSRAQTGLKTHYEKGRVKAEAFGVSSFSTRRIREIRALGISRYQFPDNDILENSEIIEIVTVDRNQPDVILNTERLTRFRDYVLEPFSGIITFRTPVSSVDQDFNPVFIRATYEVENNNERYFIGGISSNIDVSKSVDVGANIVQDNNPENNFTLASGNVGLNLGENTRIVGELAYTKTDLDGTGNAARVELRHRGKKADLLAQLGSSDKDFRNESASLGQGRTEAKARGRYKLNSSTNLNGEFLLSRNDTTGAQTLGGVMNVQRTFVKNINAEVGVRYSRQTGGNRDVTNTNLRSKLTADLPFLKGASTFGEYEQDLQDSERKLIAVGADYKIQNFAKFYARHEFISSATGRYTLNDNTRQNNTVVGVDATYMKNGQVYSEYRINDGIDGRSGQAAIGLRNRFVIREGFGLNAGFERIFTVEGTPTNDGTSISTSVDYTANPNWKGTARVEARFSSNTNSYFNSLGYGQKLSRDWTFLGKNVVALNTTDGVGGFSKIQERMRVGAAYRDITTNRFDALFRYELKYEQDALISANHYRIAHVFSTHANYHPYKDWTFSGRVAAKKSVEQDDLLKSKSFLELVTGRVIYDLTNKWDASANGSMLANADFSKKDYGLGVEMGYVIAQNLRLAGGFNFFGYSDEDLSANNYTQKGVYVGFSYKFDEQLFKSLAPKASENIVDEDMYLSCDDACTPNAEPVALLPFDIELPVTELKPVEIKAVDLAYEKLETLTVLPKHIHFNNNSTFINKPAAKMLDTVSEFLLHRDNYFIKVTGYTDRKSSYAYNLKLSERRARAVRAYMVAAGVDADKLQFEGLSFSDTEASEADRVDMAQDRRVELDLSAENLNVRFISQVEDLQVNARIPGIAQWDYVFNAQHNAVPGSLHITGEGLNTVHDYMIERIAMAMTELDSVALQIETQNSAVAKTIKARLDEAGILPSRISVVNKGAADVVAFTYSNTERLAIYEQNDDVALAENSTALSTMNNLLGILKNREDRVLRGKQESNYIVPENVIYEGNSSVLSNENEAVLSRAGSYLDAFRDVTLDIMSDGSSLGTTRANTIKKYLIAWGIPADRINTRNGAGGSAKELKLKYRGASAINLIDTDQIQKGTQGR